MLKEGTFLFDLVIILYDKVASIDSSVSQWVQVFLRHPRLKLSEECQLYVLSALVHLYVFGLVVLEEPLQTKSQLFPL